MTQSHSKMVQTRRRKQKSKKQLANQAKQAKKLKEGDMHAAEPHAPQSTTGCRIAR